VLSDQSALELQAISRELISWRTAWDDFPGINV
jgi:hypothetical protein